jgi:hypothetical protein
MGCVVSAGPCTEACERMPECTVCRRRKHPIGRDPGVYAANGYCGHDCPGYSQEPTSGHLWPGELAELRNGGAS